MADFFSIAKIVRKYHEEKERIELLQSILDHKGNGKNNCSICYPIGASTDLVNYLRSYGFKVHTIDLKDPQIKDAKATIVQW